MQDTAQGAQRMCLLIQTDKALLTNQLDDAAQGPFIAVAGVSAPQHALQMRQRESIQLRLCSVPQFLANIAHWLPQFIGQFDLGASALKGGHGDLNPACERAGTRTDRIKRMSARYMIAQYMRRLDVRNFVVPG